MKWKRYDYSNGTVTQWQCSDWRFLIERDNRCHSPRPTFDLYEIKIVKGFREKEWLQTFPSLGQAKDAAEAVRLTDYF